MFRLTKTDQSKAPQFLAEFPSFVNWTIPAIVGFGIMLVILLPHGSNATRLILDDPDNYMRLAQVRDWLAGQSWWDVTQYRIRPPEGLTMHWSRLGDIPVATAITIFRTFFGHERSELLAVTMVPLTLLMLTCLCLARAGHNLFGTSAAIFVTLAAMSTPQFLSEFVPGRIDHHGLQVLLMAATLAALTSGEKLENGAAAAFTASASIVIGLEAAPYYVLIVVWLVGRWVLNGARYHSTMLAFALGIAFFLPIIYLSTVLPSSWDRVTSDEVGQGHLLVIVGSSFLLAALASNSDLKIATRVTVIILVSTFGATLLLMAPEVVRPPYHEVDPLMQRLWLDNIIETKSFYDVWSNSPLKAVASIILPLFVLSGLAVLVNVTPRRDWVILFILLVALGIIMQIWQARSAAIGSVPLILSSGWLLALAWRKWNARLPFTMSLLLLNGVLVPSIGSITYREITAFEQQDEAKDLSCENSLAAASLNRFPPGLVLTTINLSAPMLIKTHHSVVTASNHRNYEANRLAFLTYMADSKNARIYINELRVDYVLYCRNAETDILTTEASSGLAASLNSGDAPDWLTLVASFNEGGLRFYKVN